MVAARTEEGREARRRGYVFPFDAAMHRASAIAGEVRLPQAASAASVDNTGGSVVNGYDHEGGGPGGPETANGGPNAEIDLSVDNNPDHIQCGSPTRTGTVEPAGPAQGADGPASAAMERVTASVGRCDRGAAPLRRVPA